MATIATLTMNPAVDVSITVDRVQPDRKLRGREERRDPGGGGINVCRAARELGEDASALWTCGGPIGQLLGELLDAEGVPHQPIPILELTRDNLTVHEDTTGRQYRFVLPGPPLGSEEVAACLACIRSLDPAPAYLVLSGSLAPEMAPDFYAQAAREAPSGTRVVLDTSGEPLRRALGSGIYLIKPNLRELGEVAGETLSGDREIEEVSRALIREGAAEVIVTSLGPRGAVVVTAGNTEYLHAPTVPIRSSVGAGDSMVAGIVVGMVRGYHVVEAARLGVAAGSAAVMTPGTRLCRRDDTERLFREMQGT